MKKNPIDKPFLSVFLGFAKICENGDYLCGESKDTHGSQKISTKCRGLGTLCMKKLTCLNRL